MKKTIITFSYQSVKVKLETVRYYIKRIYIHQLKLQKQNKILIYFPGHGQQVKDRNPLTAELEVLKQFNEIWFIDFDPQKYGDLMKAFAFPKIVEKNIDKNLNFCFTLMGWSHGFTEALLVAEHYRDKVEKIIGMCPTGFLNISPILLIYKFNLEGLRIFFDSIKRGKSFRVLRLGLDIFKGILKDFVNCNNISTFISDIGWAGRKVVGNHIRFNGEVIILFGLKDSLINPEIILEKHLEKNILHYESDTFKQRFFPATKYCKIYILNQNHAGPVLSPKDFIDLCFISQ